MILLNALFMEGYPCERKEYPNLEPLCFICGLYLCFFPICNMLNCTSISMILTFMMVAPEGKQMQLLLNVGGPDRVSRVQMAEAVADIRGYNTSLIKPVSASSVCIEFTINFLNL
jgi:hypothetical protein